MHTIMHSIQTFFIPEGQLLPAGTRYSLVPDLFVLFVTMAVGIDKMAQTDLGPGYRIQIERQ